MTELLLSSAVLITVLAMARLLLRGRIPPGVQYALWLVVLLRLELPFSLFSSPVSAVGTAEGIASRLTQSAEEPPEQFSEVLEQPEVPPPAGTRRVLTGVWLTGSAAAGLWLGGVHLRLAARLRRTRRRLPYRSPLPVYVAEGLVSPCLYGLFRPAVYLTESAAADPGYARIALTHEVTHWRHGDHIWTAARALCLIVYWFDPFVWLAAELSRRDGELFCDASAIRTLGEGSRFEYGRTLLALMETASAPAVWLGGALPLSGGARRLRERIARIARPARRSRLLTALVLLTAAAAAGFTFSHPAQVRPAAPVAVSAPWTAPAASTPAPVLTPEPTPTAIPTPTPEPALTPEPMDTPAPPTTPAPRAELPSSGGGAPRRVTPMPTEAPAVPAENSVASTPMPTQLPEITPLPAATAEPEELPIATPPVEGQQVTVRDMRDVYKNIESEPPGEGTVPTTPEPPSTVPDSPPPGAILDPPPEG